MLFSKTRGGDDVIEVNSQLFTEEWIKADRDAKTILDDGRPAVRREPLTEWLPATYVTLMLPIWDEIKRNHVMRELQGVQHTQTCKTCLQEMKVHREMDSSWVFTCPRCKGTEVYGKIFVGGTYGAGEKEKI